MAWLRRLPKRLRLDVLVALVATVWAVNIAHRRFSPHNYLARDGSFYATMNRSIATGFTLEQSRFAPRSWYQAGARDMDQGWSNLALGRNGRLWPKHSYLMPMVSTPLYVWFGNLGLLAFNVLQCVALVVLAFKVGERLLPAWAAALASLLLLRSPVLADHVYKYSHDVFSALLVAASLAALVRGRLTGAGVLAGFALWAKLTNAAILGPVAAALLVQGRGLRPGWWRFAAGAAAPLALYGVANTIMFGAPWITPYDRIIVIVGGVLKTESVKAAFDRPRAAGTALLLGRGDGLRALLPLAFLAAPGLVLFARRSWRLALAALLSMGAYLWLFGTYRWSHARFFLPWWPLLALGLGAILADLALAARKLLPRKDAAPAPAPAPAPEAPEAPETKAAAPTSPARARAPRRRTIAWAAALALVGLATIVRAATAAHPARLSGRTTLARVFVGDAPCDYFNPQRQKWECPRQGEGVWHFIGQPERGQCLFGGSAPPTIWAPPDPSGRPRRLIFDHLPRAAAPVLSFGQDDAAGDHAAQIELVVNGRAAGTFAPRRGTLASQPLPATLFGNDDNTVEARITGAHEAHVCFDLAW